MSKNDGRPDLDDLIDQQEAENLILWLKAAGIRAIKTAAQSALAAIPTSAVTIGTVDWRLVAGTAVLAGILSLLTSVAGVPEVGQGRSIASLANDTGATHAAE